MVDDDTTKPSVPSSAAGSELQCFIEAVEEVKQLEKQARKLSKPPQLAGKRKPQKRGW